MPKVIRNVKLTRDEYCRVFHVASECVEEVVFVHGLESDEWLDAIKGLDDDDPVRLKVEEKLGITRADRMVAEAEELVGEEEESDDGEAEEASADPCRESDQSGPGR